MTADLPQCTCPDGELSTEAVVIIGGHWPDCPRGQQITGNILSLMADAAECACGCGREVWRWRLAEECAYALAGMCAGKVRFTGQGAHRKRRAARNSYQCEVCGSWHNGSTAAVTPELEAKRAAVLAGLRARGNGAVLTILAGALDGMNRWDWKLGRERDR